MCCITADRTILYGLHDGLTTTCKYMYAPIAFGSPRYECVMGPGIGHEAIWLLPVVYMYGPGLLACSWPAYSARGWRWR